MRVAFDPLRWVFVGLSWAGCPGRNSTDNWDRRTIPAECQYVYSSVAPLAQLAHMRVFSMYVMPGVSPWFELRSPRGLC